MGLYEAIKDGVKVARKADNIEVMKQFLDAQKEALELVDQNRHLRDRVRELEDQLKTKGAFVYRGLSYWLKTEQGEEGPFCSTCWDVDGKLVRKSRTIYADDVEADGKHDLCDYCCGARRNR